LGSAGAERTVVVTADFVRYSLAAVSAWSDRWCRVLWKPRSADITRRLDGYLASEGWELAGHEPVEPEHEGGALAIWVGERGDITVLEAPSGDEDDSEPSTLLFEFARSVDGEIAEGRQNDVYDDANAPLLIWVDEDRWGMHYREWNGYVDDLEWKEGEIHEELEWFSRLRADHEARHHGRLQVPDFVQELLALRLGGQWRFRSATKPEVAERWASERRIYVNK
jgi:hypothetical protein